MAPYRPFAATHFRPAPATSRVAQRGGRPGEERQLPRSIQAAARERADVDHLAATAALVQDEPAAYVAVECACFRARSPPCARAQNSWKRLTADFERGWLCPSPTHVGAAARLSAKMVAA
jgi:hypothetical protein